MSDYPTLTFSAVFLALFAVVFYLSRKHGMLRDDSIQIPAPFSLGRVQLAMWTIIILTSFISIMLIKKEIPTFLSSTLILIGISASTTVATRMIDVSDITNPEKVRHQDDKSQGLLLDILSDDKGVSIQRFQTVTFNIVFAVWMIVEVITHLNDIAVPANGVIPDISNNNLILMGLSSATYAGLKVTENKAVPTTQPEYVRDENTSRQSNAVG